MKWLREQKSLLASLLVFLAGLVVWMVVVSGLEPVFAAPGHVSADLNSQLSADYGQEETTGSFRMISLSIVQEVFKDLTSPGADDEENAAALEEIEQSMQGQVQTATAVNFAGDPPPTLTYTPRPTSTNTPRPTATPSLTPTNTKTPVPTATLEPTKEVKPTKTPKVKKDEAPPVVNPEDDLEISTDPENLHLEAVDGVCTFDIVIDQVYVFDPEPSSGIDWVKMKYKVEGHTDYLYSSALPLICGGYDGEAWYSCHAGSVEVEIEKSWEDPVVVKVWLKVRDKEGYETVYYVTEYEVHCTD